MRLLLVVAVVVFASALFVGDVGYLATQSRHFDTFKHQVCVLSERGNKTDAKFKQTLSVLAERASARAKIDQAAGRMTEAQADRDSALLYREVSGGIGQPSTLGC